MTALAELRGVRKRYGATTALAGVDLSIARGEVLALLGPNGAGKTTAIGLLLGLRRPDAGTTLLFGREPSVPAARLRCGVAPQDSGLPDTLRVSEILAFVRAHYPEALSTDELVARFGLADVARRQAGGLSGGERRRVVVALAFAGNPELAFLDEPSSGLDVASRRALWSTIRDFAARGRSVLLTTHDLGEAQALASRVVVLNRGRVVAEGAPAEVARATAAVVVRIARQRLPALRHAETPTLVAGRLELRTDDEDALLRELVAAGAALGGIEIERPGLEELLSRPPA